MADSLRRLAAGSAECALLPRATGLLLSRELELKNLRLLPVQIAEYDRLLTFAVGPGQRDRLGPIEEGMDIVTADGTFVALFSKWAQYSGGESRIGRRLAWLLLPIVAITLISVIWTTSLRREVARRTPELHQAEAEKRAVENRIAEAQKLESLTLLAGGVAHDFNNLLSAMLGNASLALYQSSPESPVADRLREVQKAGRRAAELCQQMLAYSGRGRFVVEPLDLSKMVEDMAGLLQANVSKKAELVRRLASDLPRVEGDASQLGQLLMNLVVNASEALADQPGGDRDPHRQLPRRPFARGRRTATGCRSAPTPSSRCATPGWAWTRPPASGSSSPSSPPSSPAAASAWPPPWASCAATAARCRSSRGPARAPPSGFSCRRRASRGRAPAAGPRRWCGRTPAAAPRAAAAAQPAGGAGAVL